MSVSLAGKIEKYIKALLSQSKTGTVELGRQDLARRFNCVPSQINYVLSTRFTVEQGYMVESRRGGGGYLRISRIAIHSNQDLIEMVKQMEGEVSQSEAEKYTSRLLEAGVITLREAQIILAAVNRKTLAVALPARDIIRANIFKAIVLAIVSNQK
ncbi:transcriptional regulator CtsR [Desulfitispora alkaliphila]|uniref:CtsR family transcriptional regulator n=1 Tax=Desulfitispora alkaliphila TaxID=622674 RepID=UPI003D1E75F2